MDYRKRRFAFTITELIIAIGIFALIILTVSFWQKDIFLFNDVLNKKLIIQGEIQKTIKDFVAETRTAQISNHGHYPLEEANKDSFIFYSDIDGDNLRERIRYFLEEKTLKRGVIKPTGQPLSYNSTNEKITKLVHNLVNPNNEIFTYYDKNYDGNNSPLPQPVDILSVRLVKITITVDEDINRPPESITGISQVLIRNLKDNL